MADQGPQNAEPTFANGGLASQLNNFQNGLGGWQMSPQTTQSHAPFQAIKLDKLLGDWKLPRSIDERSQSDERNAQSISPSLAPLGLSLPVQNTSSSDISVAGGPLVVRDGRLSAMPNGFQASGRLQVNGDIVTQRTGPGHTTDYSLSQLSAHSKDPEYFAATIRYAAERQDSVTIGFRNGVANVRDPALEHSLPQDIPLRDPILRAAVIHDIDPKLLAAVGVQETHLGADYLGPSVGYNKATHRGDMEADSPNGHGYGPFQLDDGKRNGQPGLPQAELDRVARDPYYAADIAAKLLSENLNSSHGNVRDALHLYNSGSLDVPTSTTDWGPPIGALPYEDSTLKYYHEISSQDRSIDHGRTR